MPSILGGNSSLCLEFQRVIFGSVSELMRGQAEAAMRDVSEGACPLCKVALVVHDGRGCCPCCGDTYTTSDGRLEIKRCDQHGRDCQHWNAVWSAHLH